ncbi:hypothetical protein FHS43_003082 [Streptosporangium becharense]|uniref:DUF1707 domain-containing protein n=1 Tax=Streptosporangium becharense TaxID=1816182 RepID=A0A7W9MJA4_9ACTN|nr:DUF1707 domain-containing protein [Streptosporangium becharense]MBB2911809.1 hypothetical protein [Streptosporangium becharense]MBB5822373.1 hypothetical protein [Streptosporangium becharense]
MTPRSDRHPARDRRHHRWEGPYAGWHGPFDGWEGPFPARRDPHAEQESPHVGPEDLRIGDAEREVTVTALREHYAQGRLTREELDERLGLALSARTGRDLALVGADLPRPHDHRAYDRRPHHHVWGVHDLRGRSRHAVRNRTARRGGPPFAPLLLLLVVAGVAVTGFGALRFLFLAWLVLALAGLFHRRRWHAHDRRITPPGVR